MGGRVRIFLASPLLPLRLSHQATKVPVTNARAPTTLDARNWSLPKTQMARREATREDWLRPQRHWRLAAAAEKLPLTKFRNLKGGGKDVKEGRNQGRKERRTSTKE
jgi:hypothetical protein